MHTHHDVIVRPPAAQADSHDAIPFGQKTYPAYTSASQT
jgi:hypothetical protein